MHERYETNIEHENKLMNNFHPLLMFGEFSHIVNKYYMIKHCKFRNLDFIFLAGKTKIKLIFS